MKTLEDLISSIMYGGEEDGVNSDDSVSNSTK